MCIKRYIAINWKDPFRIKPSNTRTENSVPFVTIVPFEVPVRARRAKKRSARPKDMTWQEWERVRQLAIHSKLAAPTPARSKL
jgi:hypothetical protein